MSTDKTAPERITVRWGKTRGDVRAYPDGEFIMPVDREGKYIRADAAEAEIAALRGQVAGLREALAHAAMNMPHPDQCIDDALAATAETAARHDAEVLERAAQHFDQLGIMRKMWSAAEVAAAIRALIAKEPGNG